MFLTLRESGRRVAMLSNLAPYNTTAIERKFPDFFTGNHRQILSYEVGFRKPQAEIYQAACRAFDVSPSQCLFLDDMSENIAGARAVGMNAMQFSPEHYARIS